MKSNVVPSLIDGRDVEPAWPESSPRTRVSRKSSSPPRGVKKACRTSRTPRRSSPAQDLQALRVLEPKDLAEQTPGLLAKYGPNGLATVGFYLRGVGINDFTGTVDPSVGIYVDEVFQPTPDMLNFAVYDIERVEVLRGPQGTLYGRNSTGGAINFLTARPTEGVRRASSAPGYGSFHTATAYRRRQRAAVRARCSGRLSVNVVNASGDSTATRINRFTDNDLGKVDSIAARGAARMAAERRFQPAAHVQLRRLGVGAGAAAARRRARPRAIRPSPARPSSQGHVAEGRLHGSARLFRRRRRCSTTARRTSIRSSAALGRRHR